MSRQKREGDNSMRDELHSPMRSKLHPGEHEFEGEIVKRSHEFANSYDIPERLKKPGVSYQWNRMSTHNEPDPKEINLMMAQGWRFVKRDSEIGKVYTIPGLNDGTDYVEIGGLALMHRPQALTDEAHEENRKKISQQFADLNSKAMESIKVPNGFTRVTPSIKRGGRESLTAKEASSLQIPD